MNEDRFFWLFFGGIFLLVGLGFLLGASAALLGIFDTGNEAGVLLAFVGAGAILSGVGGVIVYRTLRRASEARRLRATGIQIKAIVIDVRKSGLFVNDEPRWIVRYRYRYSGGEEHIGESPSLSPERALKWRPGDDAVIVVDPREPSTSLWLGTSA